MTSFATDIRPLFRDKDVKSMTSMFDLSRYEDVKDNADGILETVEAAASVRPDLVTRAGVHAQGVDQ